MFASRRILPLLFFVSLLFAGPVALAGPDDAVVGTGTPESCTEGALNAALLLAGSITFNCGPNPVSIPITAQMVISANTQLDGGDKVTLQASTSRHFQVSAGIQLTLLNLTLSGGQVDFDGGSIYNLGTVVADNSSFTDNHTTVNYSGGFIVNYGTLTVTNSLIEGNSGGGGGAVYPRWSGSYTYIADSIVRDNHAISDQWGWGGGLLTWDGANVTIEDTQFISNTALMGGAIFNTANSNLSLDGVLIKGNQADTEGGGIYNYEKLHIENSTIEDNSSVYQGGGLYNLGGAVEVHASAFSGNLVTDTDGRGGNIANTYRHLGGDLYQYGSIDIEESTIARGSALFNGGGIFAESSVAITRTAVFSNTAGGNGGALYMATFDQGTVRIYNSTLADNSAANHGGAIYKESGALTIGYSTIAANSSQQEGDNIYMDGGQTFPTTLSGTLIAYGDCVQNNVVSQGNNLDSGSSCGLDAMVDTLNGDPMLGPMTDNGGPTLTRMPQPGSPAIDAVVPNGCPAVDQRGTARPIGAACDIGAVEVDSFVPLCGGIFPVSADTFVNESAATTGYGSATQLEVGDPSGERRTLLAFDLASALPEGVVVENARLDLPMAAAAPAGATFEVYSLDSSWSENGTWDTQPTALDSYGIYNVGGDDGTFSVDLTTLVIQWANQAIPERSVMLVPAADSPTALIKSRESGTPATLTIACHAAPTEQQGSTQADTTAQLQDLDELRSESKTPVLLDIRQGVVHFADFEIEAPPQVLAAANGDENLARAEWFIDKYQEFLRLGPDDELQLVRRSTDGMTLYFRQLHKSIPVFPSSIVIRLDSSGDIGGVTGGYTPDISLDPTPELSKDQAEVIALALAPEAYAVTGDTQLNYVNLTVLGEHDKETHLAWAVRLGSGATDQVSYIDAHTGALRFVHYWNTDVFDLDLRTANLSNRPGTQCWGNGSVTNDITWFTEAGAVAMPNPAIDADGNTAFNNIRTIYNYFMNTAGINRDSYNGAGARIDMVIDVQSLAGNAQFTPGCNELEFGDQMATLDITAHEFIHLINGATTGLVYANLSGALDESLGDIFAYLVNAGSPTARLVGTGTPNARAPVVGRAGCLTNPAFRDLQDPPCYNYNVGTPAPYPDRMSQRINLAAGATANCATNDCGFVHGNSSIHNKTAWLIMNGGEFGGRTIFPIGRANGARLFFGMITGCIGDTTDFLGASWCALSEAQEFLNANQQCQVKNAYAATGINPIVGDADCDGKGDLGETDDDNDTVPDAIDNCPNQINLTQKNQDGDALGDDCDEDIDGDGRNNPLDNCPWAANNSFPDLQNDWNNDGQGDACDDSDNDKVVDGIDNCRDIPNTGQENADGDRFGDACDTNDDNDLVPDSLDNCPLVPNNGQENGDGDLHGDACDLCPGFNHPDNGDADGDGVGNPCDPDADADGICSAGGPLSVQRGLESSPGGMCRPGRGPGPSDNCPLDPNESQMDTDSNGVGFACDAEERVKFYGIVKEYNYKFSISQGVTTKIPIPVCPQCTVQYLPNAILNQVAVEVPQTVDARVVDSLGKVVAKGSLSSVARSFSFNPAPFAASSFRAASAAGDMSVAQNGDPPPSDIFYYLELQLLPSAPAVQEVELSVEVQVKQEPPPPAPAQKLLAPFLRR